MELTVEKLFETFATPLEKLALSNPTGFWTAVGAIVICGVAYALFGYRMHHYTLIFFGFISGVASGIALTTYLNLQISDQSFPYLRWGISLGLGIVFAVFAPGFLKIFLFALGGLGVTLLLHPLLESLPQKQGLILLLIGFAGGGIGSLVLMRTTIIVSTALLGGYALTLSAFAVAQNFQWQFLKFSPNLFLGIWLGLSALTAIYQFATAPPQEKSEP